MLQSENSNEKLRIIEEKSNKSLKWTTLGEILSKLILPITNIILARLLAPEIFGIVAGISAVVYLAEIFSDAGFSKYIVQNKESEDKIPLISSIAFWVNIIVSVILFVLIASFNESIAKLIGNEGYGLHLLISAIQIPLYAMSSVYVSMLQRQFEFKKLFFVRLINVISSLILYVLFASLNFGVWTLIIAPLIAAVIQFIVLIVATRWVPKWKFNFSHMMQMFSISVFSFLEAILAWVASSLLIIFLSNTFTKDVVGSFKMAKTTENSIFTIFSAIFIPILLTTLSKLQNDKNEFDKQYFRFQELAALIVIPAIAGVMIYSEEITQIMLGNDFGINAVIVIRYYTISTGLVLLLRSFPTTYFLAIGKPIYSVITQIIFLVVYIPVAFLTIKHSNYDIFVYATTATTSILIIVTYIFLVAKFKVSLKKTFLILLKPLLPTAIMAGIGIGLKFLITSFLGGKVWISIIAMVICVLIYFLLLFLFNRKQFKAFIKIAMRK
ncbi:MAG: oligosaccharide flippase family protein [Bacilli bacterium]